MGLGPQLVCMAIILAEIQYNFTYKSCISGNFQVMGKFRNPPPDDFQIGADACLSLSMGFYFKPERLWGKLSLLNTFLVILNGFETFLGRYELYFYKSCSGKWLKTAVFLPF